MALPGFYLASPFHRKAGQGSRSKVKAWGRKPIEILNTRSWKYKSQTQQTGKLRGEGCIYVCVFGGGVRTTDFRLMRGEKSRKQEGGTFCHPPFPLRAALGD